LDQWTEKQLLHMKLGGNAAARKFFKEHGWVESGVDKFEAKYASRAAKLYRTHLEKEANKAMDQTCTSPNELASPRSSPALVDLEKGTKDEVVEADVLSPKAPVVTAGLTRPATTSARRTRLTVNKKGGKTGGGLGVKKLNTQVDDSLFEQAPAEVKPPTPVITAESPSEVSGTKEAVRSRFAYETLNPEPPTFQRGADGHLAIGAADSNDFFKDPFGSMPTRSTSKRQSQVSTKPTESTAAKERFANAKAISSDQFFNRQDDQDTSYEHQSRMENFSSATAISSDAYFGRSTDSKPDTDVSVADMAARIGFQARQEAANLKAAAQNAGKKLSTFAQNFNR